MSSPNSETPRAPDAPRYGEMRPKPQYGEYATPQEQAKIIADSLPPVSPVLTGRADATTATAPPPPNSAHRVGHPAPTISATRRSPRRFDLIISVALLAYATITVISQIFAGGTLSIVIAQVYTAEGLGTYTTTPLTTVLSNVLNVVTLVIFVLTCYITARMLRSGRISFWIPLVGGALATIVALILIGILVAADPAFLAQLRS